MILKEIINKDYESKDDLTADLGRAIQEHEELQKDFDEVVADRDKLIAENNSLKTKNLELLSMIPTIIDEEKEEKEEKEEVEISLDEILEDDLKEGE